MILIASASELIPHSYVQELPRVRFLLPLRNSLTPYHCSHDQTKTFFNLWLMTIVLSSIPYGLSTTFCESAPSVRAVSGWFEEPEDETNDHREGQSEGPCGPCMLWSTWLAVRAE